MKDLKNFRNVKKTFKQQRTCIKNFSELTTKKKLQCCLIIILEQVAVLAKENTPDDG
jgi:hypothetical protein